MQKVTSQERIAARWIPAGYTLFRQIGNNAVYATADHLHGIAYRGTSGKPQWYFRFSKEEHFLTRVKEFFDSVEAQEKRREDRRKEKADFRTTLKPGDILYTSWGWEQTNIDFYQVIAVLGKATVTIRQIAGQTTETGNMSGTRVPIPGAFLKDAPEMKKRVDVWEKRESIRIASYCSAHIWEGKPLYCSWYG